MSCREPLWPVYCLLTIDPRPHNHECCSQVRISLLDKAILAQLKQLRVDVVKSTAPGCLGAAGAQREYTSSIEPYTGEGNEPYTENPGFFCEYNMWVGRCSFAQSYN